MLGPIEASSVRVTELQSRGTRVRNTKRFYGVNPTNTNYEFTWEAVGEADPAWRCVTPKGTVASGRRGEMIFEYTPDTAGATHETFFRFKIPSYGLEELFLFAGNVVEPEVSFDRTRVDFQALMLGAVVTERVHIVNSEHMPFSFSFNKLSLGGTDVGRRRPVLEVQPMSGLCRRTAACRST